MGTPGKPPSMRDIAPYLCRTAHGSGPNSYGETVLVTMHRRENHDIIHKWFQEINKLAQDNPDLEFILPMHPNPNVQQLKHLLDNVNVIDPLKYPDLTKLLSRVKFVISDSGGIQEECAAFKKKILVCRDTTERPEGIDAGFAKIVGTDVEINFNWAFNDCVWDGENPYGNGDASKKIVDSIINNKS